MAQAGEFGRPSLILAASNGRPTWSRRGVRSGPVALAGISSRGASSADCITSIVVRHNGRHFCALQGARARVFDFEMGGDIAITLVSRNNV